MLRPIPRRMPISIPQLPMRSRLPRFLPWLATSTLVAVMAPIGQAQTAAASVPQQQTAQPDDAPTVVLRQSVRRVVVDVVVTDAQNHPVSGLAASDFQLSEEGKPQTIRHFDAHSPVVDRPETPLQPNLPPHTYINLPTAVDSGPMTVILYDLLNTPLSAQPYAHQEVVKFLKSRKTPSQTAIFILSDRLHLLRGFTDSQSELLAAIESKGAGPQRSALVAGDGEATQGSDALAQADGSQTTQPPSKDPGSSAVMLSLMSRMESLYSSAQLDRRVEVTLDALNQISRFLSSVPGRKNLIWLSASFPANIAPDPGADTTTLGSNSQIRSYSAQMKETSDLLNVSQIAVYPVDIRGLQVNPMFDASNKRTFTPNTGADLKAAQEFSQQQAAEHSTMDSISEATGGRAFYNTNGLSEAIETATVDGSNYYSLEYAPSNPNYDGTLRRINLKLKSSGYHLAYRRSYFADDLSGDKHADSPQDADLANAAPEPGSLAASMQFGAPQSHDLIFAAHVEALGTPVPATPAQMEKLVPYQELASRVNHEKIAKPNAKPKTPIQLQQYVVQYAVLARQLDLANTKENGVYRPDLSFVILAFDKDANALYGIKTSIEDVIQPARLEEVEKEGYRMVQAVYVPVNAVSLRLAVRDGRTDRTGSMEVRLPLPHIAQASAAPPAK